MILCSLPNFSPCPDKNDFIYSKYGPRGILRSLLFLFRLLPIFSYTGRCTAVPSPRFFEPLRSRVSKTGAADTAPVIMVKKIRLLRFSPAYDCSPKVIFQMFFLFLIIVYRDGIVNVFFASLYGINIKIACRTNDILPYFNKKPIQSNFLAHRNKVSSKWGQKQLFTSLNIPFFTNKKARLT